MPSETLTAAFRGPRGNRAASPPGGGSCGKTGADRRLRPGAPRPSRNAMFYAGECRPFDGAAHAGKCSHLSRSGWTVFASCGSRKPSMVKGPGRDGLSRARAFRTCPVRRVVRGYVCELAFSSQAVNRHQPAVDVLFNSGGEPGRRQCPGVILTGMGKDGAQGCWRCARPVPGRSWAGSGLLRGVWHAAGRAAVVGALEGGTIEGYRATCWPACAGASARACGMNRIGSVKPVRSFKH